jgi:hypothetical protein
MIRLGHRQDHHHAAMGACLDGHSSGSYRVVIILNANVWPTTSVVDTCRCCTDSRSALARSSAAHASAIGRLMQHAVCIDEVDKVARRRRPTVRHRHQHPAGSAHPDR